MMKNKPEESNFCVNDFYINSTVFIVGIKTDEYIFCIWISEVSYIKCSQVSFQVRPNSYCVMIDFIDKGFKMVCKL